MIGSGRCYEHPERAGIGICVECRNVICQECTTQFEGINRCARCLAKRLQVAKKAVARSEWSVGNVLLALISAAAVYGVARLFAAILSS